jgi:Domain of unknown function (DUF383)/Domain of unknown function (DUF384)
LLIITQKFPEGRKYLVTEQAYDKVIPLTKVIVFTEHASPIRRKGVAAVIKNVCFDPPTHSLLLSTSDIDVLPYILLPLCSSFEFPEDESSKMLDELQLLPPDKERDSDHQNLLTHVESLLLLSTNREGRETLREAGTYYVIRELHVEVDNDDVRESVERLVNLLMGDEAEGDIESMKARERGEIEDDSKKAEKHIEEKDQGGMWVGDGKKPTKAVVEEEEDDEDDDKVVEIF